MSDPARARKLADRIKVVVAEMLEKRIKDPRLGFVTITDSRVTNDLQHATLFYTVFGSEEEAAATAAALESARGVLRSEVGRRTGVRLTPTLTFIADAVPEHAQAIEDVLRQARERDAEVAALAAGKDFAGDADPYRRPEDMLDDDGVDDDLLDDDGLDDDGLDDDLDAELDEAASERVDGA
jgi:ribosome-binding factor A